MKILVIDDTASNRTSAKKTLEGHDVTVLGTISEAYEALDKAGATFDAILTDLFMPVGDFQGAMSNRGGESAVPVGLVFALKAISMGIRTVILTDSDHHNDRICSLLDLIGRGKHRTTRVAYVEARCTGVSTKDWLKAMEISGLFPEVEVPRPTFKGKSS